MLLAKARRLAGALAVCWCVASIWTASAAATGVPPPGLPISHSIWTALLRNYVKPSSDGINRVDYLRFKAEGHGRLKAYIANLQNAVPSRLPREAQKAFWINLYNAKTADIVLDRYPVASIRDISLPEPSGKAGDGPWKAHVVTIEGRPLSLDDISDAILRKSFADPRIHYALNCLSIGCPNLLAEAYVPERLDRQLDAAAARFVNHPRGITIKPDRITASSIYEWYVSDFGGFSRMMAHLSRFARPDLRRQLATVRKIDVYDYDWRLNDAARR